ncbi:serine integrase family protein [Streptomyces pharetrae]|uniref:hypothetical protein n=1 Tax=Streptomyces pharetrae TaxID=291370 RepID=UPI00296E2E10
MHISEMFRLVRGTGHILDVLDVLHSDRLALRIHDGAFSTTDLTACHPHTGELLSTVKFMVQALATAGELQRDLQRELTYDGQRAAGAKGSKGGRRPAVAAAKTDAVRTAYLERPLHRRPRTRPRRQPRRDPHGARRPHARPDRHRGGRPRPGAAGHPRHAGQGRRLPPRGRPGARRAGRARRTVWRPACWSASDSVA